MAVGGVRRALAALLDEWSLDSAGGNRLVSYSSVPDSVTPPAVIVEDPSVQWSGSGRTNGCEVAAFALVFVLPASSGPVTSTLRDAISDGVYAHIAGGGRDLNGSCRSWRLVSATPEAVTSGGKPLPGLRVLLEAWI